MANNDVYAVWETTAKYKFLDSIYKTEAGARERIVSIANEIGATIVSDKHESLECTNSNGERIWFFYEPYLLR